MYDGRTEYVKEYNPENGLFTNILAPRVVEFYSPHCPVCVAFSSHYIKMAENTKKLYPEIQFFGVSCVAYDEVCEQYGIEGYPTLRFFTKDDDPSSMGAEYFDSEDEQNEYLPRKITDLLNANASAATKKENEEDREIENAAKYEKDGREISINGDKTFDNIERSSMYSQMYKAQKEIYLQKRPWYNHFFGKDESNSVPGTPIEHASYDKMTKGMKENTPGTTEFRDREEAFQKRIAIDGTKQKLQGATQNLTKENLTKDIPKPYWFKIKRMSEEEELILDATLSLTVALETGMSMGITDASSKGAMKNWLNLLLVSLPLEWNIRKLIHHLRNDFEHATASTQNFKEIIKSHPLHRKKWSVSCKNKALQSQGFTCGFWKLLHVITLGVAEQQGGQNLIDAGMVVPATPVFSPSLAADTIRNYIDQFFTCRPCRQHFVQTYDDCNNNRRCERLTDDTSTKNAPDWKELSLWLWEVHNDVSVRLVRERISSTYTKGVKNTPTVKDEVSVLFPNIKNCIMCFESDGTLSKSEVFRFLERTYWPDSENDPLTDKLLTFDTEYRSEVGFLWVTILLIVWLVHKLIEKQGYSIYQPLIAVRLLVSQRGTAKSRTV